MADVELSRGDTELFIELFHQQPVLWCISSPDYHKKDKRQTALRLIADRLGKNWTEQQVSKKISLLRSYYNKELAKVKKVQSGQSAGAVYKSSWAYFDVLDVFLRDYTVPRKSTTNFKLMQVPVQVHAEESSSENDITRLIDQCSSNTGISQEEDNDRTVETCSTPVKSVGQSCAGTSRSSGSKCKDISITSTAVSYLKALSEKKERPPQPGFVTFLAEKMGEIKNKRKRAKLEMDIHQLVQRALFDQMDDDDDDL